MNEKVLLKKRTDVRIQYNIKQTHVLHISVENSKVCSGSSAERNLRGGFAMEWYQMDAKKCLEFSKKMAVLRRLVHLGLISENEYILAKNKIMSSYHILESEYFKTGAGNRVA